MEILNKKSQQEAEMQNDKYRFGTLDEYDRGMFEGAATICYVSASFLIVILAILITVAVKIF